MSMYPSGIENNGGAAGGLATAAGTFFGGPVGGALAGSLASGLFGRSSAKDQMKFQERMASTQYQRAAKDLEAAGLNRVLALGSPAASPGGAGWSMPDLGSTMSSAKQASTASAGQKSLESLQKVQEASAMASARQANATAAATEQITPAQVSKANSEAISAEKNAQRDAMINEMLKKADPYLIKGLDSIGTGITGATDAIRSVVSKVSDVIEGMQNSAKAQNIKPAQLVTDMLGITGHGKAKKADEEWNKKSREADEDYQARQRARQKDRQL